MRSETYYEQMLILFDKESEDDILIKSAGLFVGGDRKLLIWNEIVDPAAISLANKFETVTLFWFCVPEHCSVDLTFEDKLEQDIDDVIGR